MLLTMRRLRTSSKKCSIGPCIIQQPECNPTSLDVYRVYSFIGSKLHGSVFRLDGAEKAWMDTVAGMGLGRSYYWSD